MAQKTIRIYGKEVKTEKNSFITFSSKINNRYYKIKFTKDVDGVPKRKGVYNLTVNTKDISVQNGGKYEAKDGTIKDGTPTLWIKSFVTITKVPQDVLDAENKKVVDAIFDGDDDDDDDDIPF